MLLTHCPLFETLLICFIKSEKHEINRRQHIEMEGALTWEKGKLYFNPRSAIDLSCGFEQTP